MRLVDRLFQFGVFLTVIWFVGLGAWWLGTQLSSDAIGLALGVIFGILGGLPGALLALSVGRRGAPAQPPAQQWPPSPPVVVITGSTSAALPGGERALLADHWSKPQDSGQRLIDVQAHTRAPVQSDAEGGWYDA